MKSFIDSAKPMALYLGTLGLLMLLSVMASSIPALSLSAYIDWPTRKYWAAGLFVAGAAFSVIAFALHARRAVTPWVVTRAHVTLPFLAGSLALLAAVVISR